ncbi:MAG: MOP flippase family protein [Betaproteobacteria bacterium]
MNTSGTTNVEMPIAVLAGAPARMQADNEQRGAVVPPPSSKANARWVALSQAARILSQLASVALLSRLLQPEDYGLMAMAMVVSNCAYLFRDMGTAAAIIQKDRLSPAMVDTVHWTNVALGLLIGAIVLLAAPVVAAAFHAPDLEPLLRVLALVFPLSSFGVSRQALFERESKFSLVAFAEVLASFLGLAVALVLAWGGAGVWSLVAQVFVASAVLTAVFAAASGYRPALSWQRAQFKALLGFSGHLTLFNCVNYLSRNADSMVIGRLLGTAPLGIYSMAYRLMLFPVQNMTWVATRALFPVMSRHQNANAEIARLYLKSIAFIAFLTAPMMAGLAALREPFVTLVFGERWNAVAQVIAWLAPAGFIQSVVSASGTLFMAKGKTDGLFRLGVAGAVVQIAAFTAGSHWGINGVAGWYLTANVILAIPVLHFSTRLIGLGMGDVLRAIWRPVALGLALFILLSVADKAMANAGISLMPRFCSLVLAGALAYALGGYAFAREQFRDLFRFLRVAP